MPGDLIGLDALGPDGEYRTRKREVISDTAGQPVAEMSVVPRLFVTRSVAAQRKVAAVAARRSGGGAGQGGRRVPPRNDRWARRSTTTSPDLPGVGAADDRGEGGRARRRRLGGDGVRRGVAGQADGRTARMARDAPGGGAVWARRGEVLAVHAPGNAPGVHGLWPQALALGYRVAVRPSRREPFTAHRLVHALRQAGFRDEDALFLPTDYAGADDLVAAADLALVYGGEAVADRYAADPTVLVNGPGRTKIVITAECDWREHLDVIVDSIAGLGGMACVNATAVLYEGDPEPLARAIAERLSAMTPLPNIDERATLPTTPIANARAIAAHLAVKAAGTQPILGADQVVADLGDGYAALRPAVHLLAAPNVDTINVELPFPCVWVSGWSRNSVVPLRNSLVVTAITEDRA